MKGNIYLIREREFKRLKENIYKLGYTEQLDGKRLLSYPKGSELYISIESKNAKKSETTLMRIFERKYSKKKEYGNEYFEGEKDEMLKDIIKECKESMEKIVDKKSIFKKFEEELERQEEIESGKYFEKILLWIYSNYLFIGEEKKLISEMYKELKDSELWKELNKNERKKLNQKEFKDKLLKTEYIKEYKLGEKYIKCSKHD